MSRWRPISRVATASSSRGGEGRGVIVVGIDGLLTTAEALAAGAVVAIPTDTVYGLAVAPGLRDAIGALFALKGRPVHVALPVLVADLAQAADLVADEASAGLRRLAGAFWPGPLTIVVAAARGRRYALGGDGGSIGLRCPGHPLALELLARTGPLAVTSANRHGAAPCTSADEVGRTFGDLLPLVLDGGVCDGTASSVVSLLGPRPDLLRAGPVGLDEIVAALG